MSELPQPPEPLTYEHYDRPPVTPDVPQRPSWVVWLSVSVVLLGTCVCYIAGSVLGVSIAAMISGNAISVTGAGFEDLMPKLMQDRRGFFAIVILPQLGFLVFPLAFGLLSPVSLSRELGFVKGRWPLWCWGLAVLATPLVGIFSSVLLSLLQTESESLKSFGGMIRFHSRDGFLIPVALAIGFMPGFCEEVLFRGFLQKQLVRVLPSVFAILGVSVLFAAMHLDPVHALGVLPLGLWLGFLTHRSGSLYPAMIAHTANNIMSVLLVALLEVPSETVQMLPIFQ